MPKNCPYPINSNIFGISSISFDPTSDNDLKYQDLMIDNKYLIIEPKEITGKQIKICFYISEYKVIKYNDFKSSFQMLVKAVDKFSIERDKRLNLKHRIIESKDIDICVFPERFYAENNFNDYIEILRDYIFYVGKKKLKNKYTI